MPLCGGGGGKLVYFSLNHTVIELAKRLVDGLILKPQGDGNSLATAKASGRKSKFKSRLVLPELDRPTNITRTWFGKSSGGTVGLCLLA